MSLRKELDEEQVKKLRDWWEGYAGGRPVPKRSEMTIEELQDMTVQVVAIKMGGTVIVKTEESDD